MHLLLERIEECYVKRLSYIPLLAHHAFVLNKLEIFVLYEEYFLDHLIKWIVRRVMLALSSGHYKKNKEHGIVRRDSYQEIWMLSRNQAHLL
jgi:hypothetical protein